jgi:hypothetical protein
MFKYARVQLNRSETTTFALDVPPWEVAVLAAVNGEDRVQVIGETPVNKPLPDPAAEFDRLVTKYKADNESGQDYVSLVYGVGQRGVSALKAEIDKARAQAAVPPMQTREYDSKDDPLAGLFDAPPPVSLAEGAVEIAQ